MAVKAPLMGGQPEDDEPLPPANSALAGLYWAYRREGASPEASLALVQADVDAQAAGALGRIATSLEKLAGVCTDPARAAGAFRQVLIILKNLEQADHNEKMRATNPDFYRAWKDMTTKANHEFFSTHADHFGIGEGQEQTECPSTD